MRGFGRHSMDYEFRADDFDDLERRPAATKPEIEPAPIVLVLDRHCVLHRVFDVCIDDAVFVRRPTDLHAAIVRTVIGPELVIGAYAGRLAVI